MLHALRLEEGLAASIPARCRGASTRGTFATGCWPLNDPRRAIEVASDCSGCGVVFDHFMVSAGRNPDVVLWLKCGIVQRLAVLEIDDFIVQAVDDQNRPRPKGLYLGGR